MMMSQGWSYDGRTNVKPIGKSSPMILVPGASKDSLFNWEKTLYDQ